MASPLFATADTSAASTAPVWPALGTEQLLPSDPGADTRADPILLDTRTSMQEGFQQSPLGNPWNGRNERGAQGAGHSLAEQIRHLVNVGSVEGAVPAQARGGNRAPRPAPAGFAGIDMGEATDQWLKDTVQALVDSTLRLEVNEHGRSSFSVLGLGDFSLSVSADRSQIALSAGNEALFIVDRPSAAGGIRESAADAPLGSIRGAPGLEQPAIRQVMELIADMATHPISLLVYCVIASYLVLWNLLSHQRNKPLTTARRFESVYTAPAADERPVHRRRSRRSRRRTHSRRASA